MNLMPNITKKKEIGKVVEKNGGPLCLFCCKFCREYENEFATVDTQHSGGTGNVICTSHRPYKCTFFNFLAFIDFCKPEMTVKKGHDKIGSVEWPCWCNCWPARGCLSCMEFDIKDGSGNPIYKITAPCL